MTGSTTIRKITEILPKPERDFVYDIVAALRPLLCLDVGAAAGVQTRRIRLLGGTESRVVAFEPFVGNFAYFEETTRDLYNVVLIKKAVGERVGRKAFVVPSVIAGTERGWETFKGYSSVGFLAKDGNPSVRSKLVHVAGVVLDRLRRRHRPRRVVVDTTSLDAEFPHAQIDFAKIDVQGGEEGVLAGAARLLSEGRLSTIYLEWSGDPVVPSVLARHGYTLYDSTYVIGANSPDVRPLVALGFTLVGEINLSTGKRAYEMTLNGDAGSPAEAMCAVVNAGLGWIQTDLIAVAPRARDSFAEALDQYARRSRRDEVKPTEVAP
jgi:FkbM family methyltransferase